MCLQQRAQVVSDRVFHWRQLWPLHMQDMSSILAAGSALHVLKLFLLQHRQQLSQTFGILKCLLTKAVYVTPASVDSAVAAFCLSTIVVQSNGNWIAERACLGNDGGVQVAEGVAALPHQPHCFPDEHIGVGALHNDDDAL